MEKQLNDLPINLKGFEYISAVLRKTEKGWGVYEKSVKILIKGFYKSPKEAITLTPDYLKSHNITEEKYLKAIKKEKREIIKNRFCEDIGVRTLFRNIFGFDFITCLASKIYGQTRLDIITFDKKLGTPDGISIKEFIRHKYGEKAVKLVQKMI